MFLANLSSLLLVLIMFVLIIWGSINVNQDRCDGWWLITIGIIGLLLFIGVGVFGG